MIPWLYTFLLAAACTPMAATSAEDVDSARVERLVPQFAGALDDALRAISMSATDVAFRTDHVDRDSFRLAAMDSRFRDPLGGLDSTYAMSAEIRRCASPADVVRAAMPWLDLKPPPLPPTRPADGPQPSFDEAMASLALAVEKAHESLSDAFGELSPDELDSLRNWTLSALSDDDEPGNVDIFAMRAAEHAERERARMHLALARRVDNAAIMRAAVSV